MEIEIITYPRRRFLKQAGLGLAAWPFAFPLIKYINSNKKKDNNMYDVIIIGGSYAGLSAAMALGRALRSVLIIDDSKPCNRQTPLSHNFLTNDGKSPAEITKIATEQVQKYDTINFCVGLVTNVIKIATGFNVKVASGEIFATKKLIFATGIKDVLPSIDGLSAFWGISVLHCPYCHGYEVRNEKTGIIANGDKGYDFSRLISNWTKDLILFTNGKSSLTSEQTQHLQSRNIIIEERKIGELVHDKGLLQNIQFEDGGTHLLTVLYVPVPFEQSCPIPKSLGCEQNEEGYIIVDSFQETTVKGVFACGDNTARMRTVANAVSTGTTAGMALSKKMILEEF